MLTIRNISKDINDIKILDDISYEFSEGKIYVIKGISGCGKSTLLNIIAGIDNEYSGKVIYNDIEVEKQKEREVYHYKQKIGYVFQNSVLLGNVTVMENLRFICNDIDKIYYWANKLKVFDELTKYPKQLSGGQRQRISLIRVLLLDCKIIVADEPTAALDKKNSELLASVFKELISEDKIIIISTHENCFDKVADVIIIMTYRKFEKVECISDVKLEEKIEQKRIDYKDDNIVLQYLYDVGFVNNRNKTKRNKKKTVSSVIIFSLLLCCVVMQLHFSEIFRKILFFDYKYNVFSIDEDKYQRIKDEIDLKVYENYNVDCDDNTVALPLFEKEDSCLSVSNIICNGKFPKQDNEILVNESYAINVLGVNNIDEAVGRNCKISSTMFYVSGVVINSDNSGIIESNNYYCTEKENIAYIPYNIIKKIGKKKETLEIMVVCDDMYDKHTYSIINSQLHNYISIWDDKIKSCETITEAIIYIVFAGVLLIALIAIMFIYNSINLELFYRSKEIGYLQIFNVSKRRIAFVLILEKIYEWERIIIISFIISLALLIYIKIYVSINIIYDIAILFCFVIICNIYCIFVTYLPIRKFLKKDVISLIKT